MTTQQHDFLCADYSGTVASIVPITEDAEDWLQDHIGQRDEDGRAFESYRRELAA